MPLQLLGRLRCARNVFVLFLSHDDDDDGDGARARARINVNAHTPRTPSAGPSRLSVAGGAIAYVKWAHAAGERAPDGAPLRRREDFFTSRLCRAWFKAFVSKMLTRVNAATGVAYRDDPTIFAWELINEPRVQGDASGDVLQAWIEDVAAYAKTLDDAHLLTVGTEGFYGVTDAARASNEHPPGGGAERLGPRGHHGEAAGRQPLVRRLGALL